MKEGAVRDSRFKSYWIRHWGLYAMLLLPLIYFFIFNYLPMPDIMLAFRQNNVVASVWDIEWVGWSNFERVFSLTPFRDALRNTLMFSALDLAIGFPAPIILALLLNELKFLKFKRFTQTVSYMPFFVSWVIIGIMATDLFATTNGSINVMLRGWFGENFTNINFLGNPTNWVVVNVSLNLWRTVGWGTILYLAAITNVNPELYEAADMDGASRLRKIWHVTLPAIRPVIAILLILTLGQILGADLVRFLALDNLLVRSVSEVLPTFVYRWGLQSMQFAMATAVGLVQSTIGMFLLLGGNWTVKKLGGNGFW